MKRGLKNRKTVLKGKSGIKKRSRYKTNQPAKVIGKPAKEKRPRNFPTAKSFVEFMKRL